MTEWINLDHQLPPEGEYVLVRTSEECIGITRLIDGEWDTGERRKRVVFSKTERFFTSANGGWWMPLPELPIK